MSKLFGAIYILVAPTVAGIFVIALLAYDQMVSNGLVIAGVAVVGAIIALPVAWIIARKVRALTA